jgi:glutathione S-transferase
MGAQAASCSAAKALITARILGMFTVYGMADSGNCYKVKLALEQLQLPYRWVEVDSTRGETRSKQFLAMNPNGKVPTLGLEDGGYLPESNAILNYLAEGSRLLPADRLGRARVLQWMFFEQYSHEPYVAVARAILRYQPPDSPRRAELPRLQERGNQALAVMDQHLSSEPFFAGRQYSVADIALFAYTHCAADGGFDLARYPGVRAWLERVQAQPRFVPLQA